MSEQAKGKKVQYIVGTAIIALTAIFILITFSLLCEPIARADLMINESNIDS